MDHKQIIASGQVYLGIELGSTRIKAVLTAPDHTVLASGSFGWENRLEDGVWTYHLDDVVAGLRACYSDLRQSAERVLGAPLRRVGAIGVSAMMHGYLALDKSGRQLAPFRTGAIPSPPRQQKSSPSASATTSRSVGAPRTCIRQF